VRAMIRYTTPVSDSDRWRRFEHRAGDVVISAPQKSGMTWTQMLCALVIFDGTAFPASLDEMSPWLDMLTRSEDEVFGLFARQRHRRFIKTHTPLDGLPLRDDVTYLVVGRDPRDAAISFEHHLANVDGQKLSAVLAEATGTVLELPPAAPDEPSARFRAFVDGVADSPLAHAGRGAAPPSHRLEPAHTAQRGTFPLSRLLSQSCRGDGTPGRRARTPSQPVPAGRAGSRGGHRTDA